MPASRFDMALALGLAAFAGSTAAGAAAERRPVVVELFTSQGCSSCPPANANLIRLLKRSDVLALSYSVTYWDYLGWKDRFGKPEFTDRQVAYEPGLGQAGPFTPQMVVDGRTTTVGVSSGEVEGLISSAAAPAGPDIALGAAKATIGAGSAPSGGADIWLVRYEPGVIETPVVRGENAGRTLPHGNVVRELSKVGAWTGKPVSVGLTGGSKSLKTAILVQARGGPILAAATE